MTPYFYLFYNLNHTYIHLWPHLNLNVTDFREPNRRNLQDSPAKFITATAAVPNVTIPQEPSYDWGEAPEDNHSRLQTQSEVMVSSPSSYRTPTGHPPEYQNLSLRDEKKTSSGRLTTQWAVPLQWKLCDQRPTFSPTHSYRCSSST